MNSASIEVYQKNTKNIPFSVTEGGVSFPLTGYTCRLIVKKEKEDAVAVLDTTSSDYDENVVTFELTDTQTDLDLGDYYYELYITKAAPLFAKTAAQGIFSVLKSLTA